MKRAIENRRKGMTLVELIVGFALVAILSAALVGIISPVYRTYQRTRAVSDAEALAGNIIDAIRTSANSASTLSADDDAVHVGVIAYSVSENGRLMYELEGSGEPQKSVFDEKYYNGKTIDMEARQPNPAVNTVQVTIHVTTRDGVTVSQTGVISTLRQYIAGSHSVKLDSSTVGGGGGGIQDDGTDWTRKIGDALLNTPRNNTQMNVDSGAPIFATNKIPVGYGNWTGQVMLSLAKLLFPEDASVTTETAKGKLAEAGIKSWAIRNKDSDNCVFLSGVDIQSLQKGAQVPVICLDLKKNTQAYRIGYATVHETKKVGNQQLTTPYKTLGTGDNSWKKDFYTYATNGVESYATYKEALAAYNQMPLVKP